MIQIRDLVTHVFEQVHQHLRYGVQQLQIAVIFRIVLGDGCLESENALFQILLLLLVLALQRIQLIHLKKERKNE